VVNVPQSVLEQLQATVKIDITPKGVYDKFAQEQTIENLLIQGFFNAQRVSELATYCEVLDDDSVAPKAKIKEAIEHIRDEQRKIAMIEAQDRMMQQRVQQFLMGDPDEQSSMMSDAMMQLQMEQMAQEEIPGEEEYEEMEDELDEEVPEETEEKATIRKFRTVAFSICPDMEDIKSTWNMREQASIKK
jgi:hypothetical protein